MVSQRLSFLSPDRLFRFVGAILLALTLAVSVASTAAEAAAPRKFAGIVVDAKSGKVLYESSADAARYPASVTKVMTLYVLFQELAAGNIRLSDKMTVSKHAAAAVPTKLGLKAGSKIAVEDAIKALVTLSANDIARVIAEHISGTESAFAQRMTATAKALGMHNTTYRNASGLPDGKQVTTVRDQSVLGIAIYQHFPKYYAYFQTKSFSYGKRTYGNHNRLLGSNSVDGIKTGYTRASGYNLLTAARSESRHIVVVGFGFDTAGSRDAKVRELVKTYFSKGRSGDYTQVAMIPHPGRKGSVVASDEPVYVVPMPYPAFRLAELGLVPVPVDAEVITASVNAGSEIAPIPASRPQDLGQDAVEAAAIAGGAYDPDTDVIGAWLSETFSLGAEPAPLGETRPSAPLVPPVGIGDGGAVIDPMTSQGIGDQAMAVVDQEMPAMPEGSGWIVQVGAAPTETAATTLLHNAAGSVDALGDFRPFVERFVKDGQTFYRARFGGFGDRGDAAAMCGQLKKAKMSCLALQG